MLTRGMVTEEGRTEMEITVTFFLVVTNAEGTVVDTRIKIKFKDCKISLMSSSSKLLRNEIQTTRVQFFEERGTC